MDDPRHRRGDEGSGLLLPARWAADDAARARCTLADLVRSRIDLHRGVDVRRRFAVVAGGAADPRLRVRHIFRLLGGWFTHGVSPLGSSLA